MLGEFKCTHTKYCFSYSLNSFVNCSENKWIDNLKIRFKIVENSRRDILLYNRINKRKLEKISPILPLHSVCKFSSCRESKIKKIKEIIYSIVGTKLYS